MRAAVVGAGNIARQHLAALRDLPGVSVAAVCDVSRAAAEAAAEDHDVRAWYTDHRSLLEDTAPDVVHVTTPAPSHFPLVLDALAAGAHVVVEKPAAVTYAEVEVLVDEARRRGRALVEDYNYLFNRPVRDLRRLVASGALGTIVHVEVTLCLDPGATSTVVDFLPHLASLTHLLVGAHRGVSCVGVHGRELRAVIDGERATAALCFSAVSRPDTFLVRVHGTDARATANVFEPGLVVESDRSLPRPLVPVVNGIDAAWTIGRSAVGSLWGKLSGGPGTYEGLWEHLRLTYEALQWGHAAPVSLGQVLEVNRLVADLREEAAL